MSLSHLLDTSVYCQPIKKNPLASVEAHWREIEDQSLCISRNLRSGTPSRPGSKKISEVMGGL